MIVKEPESQFIPAPAGVHAAVCVDEVDMGLQPNRFDPQGGPKLTVRLVWQIAEDMKDGKPFLIKKDYTASLHEKAALRKDLQSWRGRDFTFDELVGFDLEKIVGVHCMLNIVHKTGSKGGTFSNIAAIMPLAKGMMKLEPREYVRVKDRSPQEKETAYFAADQHIDDDDVPF